MKERLLELSSRISSIKSKVKNEEATKQSMILPLLSILGYDIFNPDEVEPEVSCDIAGKGDRIDYVICRGGNPQILIECKDWRQNLDAHINQLRKYFVASEARFAILTNGIKYLFFSDHDKANIMDQKPFYALDMESISDSDIDFIAGLSKESFNSMQLLAQSQDIKYRSAILRNLKKEFSNPSKGFVSILTSDFYHGKLHDSIYNKFSTIIKDCLRADLKDNFICNDKIIEESEGIDEKPSEYIVEEQRIIDMVKGWLSKYETDEFKIHITKLSDGYIRFAYNSRWWNICRIKYRPYWEWKICVKIFPEAISENCTIREYKTLDDFIAAKEEIEAQCDDTKSRFFKYRLDHNL